MLLENKTRLIMISERLMKEETLEGPLFESLFNQPIDNPQSETSSILAGLPYLNPSTNGDNGGNGDYGEQPLLPEPGATAKSFPLPSQLQPPYTNVDTGRFLSRLFLPLK